MGVGGGITFERVITLSLLATMIGCTLPLVNSPSKFKVVCYNIVRCIGFVNHSILAIMLIHTSYNCVDNTSLVISSTLLACVCFCGNVQIIICQIQSRRLQMIIAELQSYSKMKESWIRKIIQTYIDEHIGFYGGLILSLYFSSITFIFGPFLMSRPFPTQAVYPLPMEKPLLRCLLYIHQSFASAQSAAQISLVPVYALFYWYVTARFDVLTEKFKMAQNTRELKKRIKEHQYLVWLTQEIIDATKFNIAAELIFGSIRIVFSALDFLRPQPWAERTQYVVINFMTLYSSFAVIWPADFLLHLNEKIQNACYESAWCEKSASMRKTLLMVMLSCQKRLSLSIGFFLKAASLEYYRMYLSTAVSYFTVLHVVFGDNSV